MDNGDNVDGKSVSERAVDAINRLLIERPGIEVSLHGHEKNILDAFGRKIPSRVDVIPATSFYSQSDKITRPVEGTALNNLVGAVKGGDIGGFFSIGDTSKIAIESTGIRNNGCGRPALVAIFPSLSGEFVFSDVGFTSQRSNNASYENAVGNFARDIYRQGLMASVYAGNLGIEKPR